MPSARPLLLIALALSLSLLSACRSSKTAKKIASFADEVCACQDAECAKGVQESYLTWWKDHQRARGSEEDHKEVEGSMERFAKCYRDLVGEEKSTIVPAVPKVDLSPPTAKPAAPVVPAATDEDTAEVPQPDTAVPQPDKESPSSDKATSPAHGKTLAPENKAPEGKAPEGKAPEAPAKAKEPPVSP